MHTGGQSEEPASEAGESGRAPRRTRPPIEKDPAAAAQDESDSGGAPPPAPDAPWWHSKLLVTLITVLGAAIAPFTAWLSAAQQRSLESERHANAAELQVQQQQHATRIEFFEKVVSPSIAMTPESRLEALRYFRAVLPPGDLQKWAQIEHDDLQRLLAERERAQEERERAEAEATVAGDRARTALGQLEATPAANVDRRNALLHEADQQASAAKQRAAKAEDVGKEVAAMERKIKRSVPTTVARAVAATAGAGLAGEDGVLKSGNGAGKLAEASAAPVAEGAAKALPPTNAASAFELGFSAQRSLLSETETATYYRFSVAIAAAPPVLERIARVEYRFDHPTFSQKSYASEDRARRFEVSYRGWGCLTQVSAALTLRDGQVLRRTFDMCALLQ
jgi:hypothetical protein